MTEPPTHSSSAPPGAGPAAEESRPGRESRAEPVAERPGHPVSPRSFNLAMTITIARTPLPLLLPLLAYGQLRWAVVALIASVWFLDWLDGKIARARNEFSRLGARLDSAGDILLFAAMIPSLWWLEREFLQRDWIFIALPVAAYGLAVLVSLLRFGVWPSYHTRAAKVCAFLVAFTALLLFADGPEWPVKAALIAVFAANIEQTLISLTLRQPQTDIPSIFHALRQRCASPAPPAREQP